VLFTTGYRGSGIVRGGRPDVEIPLLPKPFTAEALARKVSQLLAITISEGRPN
jgi:hypothetical protein